MRCAFLPLPLLSINPGSATVGTSLPTPSNSRSSGTFQPQVIRHHVCMRDFPGPCLHHHPTFLERGTSLLSHCYCGWHKD